MLKMISAPENDLVNEMIQDHEKLLNTYSTWKKNKQIEDVNLLQWNVTTFINDCRYTINRSNAKKIGKLRIGKSIVSKMERYMNFWSRALVEIRIESQFTSQKIQRDYYQNYYSNKTADNNETYLTEVLNKKNTKKFKALSIKREY
ncbi:MAG: hypothetical protein HS100_07790 [Anaerolineales bacterium]|nr:hypothetical protein [Anaerolineales bacterium]